MDLELSALLDAAAPEWKVAEERIAADLSEVKVAMVAVGISPVKLRRALRAELGRKQDAANILKPALARGAIRVIGATTTREYRQTIEKDGAGVGRDRRACPLVRPHGRCVCVDVEKRKNCFAHSHSSSHFTHGGSQGGARPPSPTAAVEWSVRHLPDFRFPDKALDLVDQACAAARFHWVS